MALEFTPDEEKQLEYLLSKREKTKGPVPEIKVSAKGRVPGAMGDASKRQRDDDTEWSSSYSDRFEAITFPNLIESE